MPQPVNLTVRYIHSATRYQFIQRAALFMALMISRFRKSTCRFSSSGKRRCTDRGSRREYWQFHLRSATTRKYRMRFPPLQRSLWHSSVLCVGLRTRKSMAFVLNSPGGRLPRWPAAVLQPPGAAFRSSISASLSAYHFMTAAES